MTNEEIMAYQARIRAFAETPIGKAFMRFKSAHARAWCQDTEDSFNDRDRKSTKEAHDLAHQYEKEIIQLVEALNGQ